MLLNNVDRFLNFSTSGYDILGNQKTLSRLNCKSSPKHQPAVFFLREDMSFCQVTGYFLADDDSSESRRNDRIELQTGKLRRQFTTNPGGYVGVLQHEGALKILPAVQAGAEDKVAAQQSSGSLKQI